MLNLGLFICAVLFSLMLYLIVALMKEIDAIKDRMFKIITMQDMQEEAIDELYSVVYGGGQCCPDGECEMSDEEIGAYFKSMGVVATKPKEKKVKKTTKKPLTKKK